MSPMEIIFLVLVAFEGDQLARIELTPYHRVPAAVAKDRPCEETLKAPELPPYVARRSEPGVSVRVGCVPAGEAKDLMGMLRGAMSWREIAVGKNGKAGKTR